MAKIKFDFNKNDMYNYLSDRFKMKTPKKSKQESNETKKRNKDEAELENLTTMRTKSKKIEKNIIRKATLLIINIQKD